MPSTDSVDQEIDASRVEGVHSPGVVRVPAAREVQVRVVAPSRRRRVRLRRRGRRRGRLRRPDGRQVRLRLRHLHDGGHRHPAERERVQTGLAVGARQTRVAAAVLRAALAALGRQLARLRADLQRVARAAEQPVEHAPPGKAGSDGTGDQPPVLRVQAAVAGGALLLLVRGVAEVSVAGCLLLKLLLVLVLALLLLSDVLGLAECLGGRRRDAQATKSRTPGETFKKSSNQVRSLISLFLFSQVLFT